MVDYVLIDHNSKPLKNLNVIKPDLFAKGFEYSSRSLTTEGEQSSESYGGKMLFTPGDIVYSSTNLLKLSSPQLKMRSL